MSGGVDSSVAAYLLKQQGYEVIGATLNMWREEGETDPFRSFSDAAAVCKALEIPHVIVDAAADFRETVVQNFLDEYAAGRTPNPCVICNPLVKWNALLKEANRRGADYIATGHYALIEKIGEDAVLKRSEFEEKDQTYALYRLTSTQLKRTLMPLGSLEKSSVRAIAAKFSAMISAKKDSQEICFIPRNDHADFLKRNLPEGTFPEGNFVDKNNNFLGVHQGIGSYTVGQRKGLGIAMGHPVYVTRISKENNTVTLGENEELFTKTVEAGNIIFSAGFEAFSGDCYAKIRYGQKPSLCYVETVGERLIATFREPVRAVTPGQSIVLYKDNYVVGGGIIR